MRLKPSWTSIGTVSGVLTLVVAVWVAYTTGTFSAPKLEFGFGASRGWSGGDLRKAGLSKDGPVTYLVLTSESKDVSRAAFMLPFYVSNKSSRALHDVVVRFTYPTRAIATFDTMRLIDPPGEFRINPEYTKLRTVKEAGSNVTTEFQIPVIRPGEGMILGDMLILGDPSLMSTPVQREANVRLLTFPERLREQTHLLDLLRVSAFASAAEAGPYTAGLTVVWARTSSSKDAVAALGDRISSAAWGPHRPKPGTYFKWPWDPKLSQTEFFEFLQAPLLRGVLESGEIMYVQRVSETGMIAFSTSMPPWDYWGPIGD
jgi:hypothetical protein